MAYLAKFYGHIQYPVPSKGNILIYAGIGHMYLTHTEILLYHLLRKKGFQVDYYIYNEHIAINEIITQQIVKNGKDKFWKKSIKNATSILRAAKVKYSFITKTSQVDDLIVPLGTDLERILTFKYQGVHFGNIVKGVMYRYYKSIEFESDAGSVAKKFLETALTNYFQVKQLTEKKKYKFIMFSHGIYCTWEPVVEFCKKNEINFISYDRAKIKATTNFNLNQPAPDWSFSIAWERNIDRELTSAEESKVDKYLLERELQTGDVYSYNPLRRHSNLDILKKEFGIRENVNVITLFTNLIWDAANVARDIAFDSMLDCICNTIEYYRDNSRVHILIRSHPAEKLIGSGMTYNQLILEKIELLPNNCTLIPVDMDINSFSILDISDIGIVHTSTVGLEMAMGGKHVILISETHYRNKGFTHDVKNKTNYFNALDGLLESNLLLPNQINLARKYFYMMMFEYQQKIPIIYKNGVFEKYSYDKFQSLTSQKHESINRVVQKIANGDNLVDFLQS